MPYKFGKLKEKQIKKILSCGKYKFNQYFTILWLPNQNYLNNITFIISKKVDNRAVIRNKIRRVLIEVLRKKHFNLKRGYNLLVIPKPKAKFLSNKDLKMTFNLILTKTNLLKDEKGNSKIN